MLPLVEHSYPVLFPKRTSVRISAESKGKLLEAKQNEVKAMPYSQGIHKRDNELMTVMIRKM